MSLSFSALQPGTKEMVVLAEAAHPFEFTFSRNDQQWNTRITLFLDVGASVNLSADAVIDDTVFERGNPLRDIFDLVVAAKELLQEHIHDKVGDYPYARVWMFRHLKSDRQILAGGPIPGWMWQRFREYPAHQGAVASRSTYELVDKDSPMATQVAKPKRKPTIIKPEVKKAPKKPKCPLHHEEMKFDPLRGAWECKTDGCNQIALPKRERIEGQLLLGKGKVQMRIVYPDKGEPPRLILISDDNVAIDITELCTAPVQELMDEQAISDAVEEGFMEGVPEVAFKRFTATLKSNGVVMGVVNAP